MSSTYGESVLAARVPVLVAVPLHQIHSSAFEKWHELKSVKFHAPHVAIVH